MFCCKSQKKMVWKITGTKAIRYLRVSSVFKVCLPRDSLSVVCRPYPLAIAGQWTVRPSPVLRAIPKSALFPGITTSLAFHKREYSQTIEFFSRFLKFLPDIQKWVRYCFAIVLDRTVCVRCVHPCGGINPNMDETTDSMVYLFFSPTENKFNYISIRLFIIVCVPLPDILRHILGINHSIKVEFNLNFSENNQN